MEVEVDYCFDLSTKWYGELIKYNIDAPLESHESFIKFYTTDCNQSGLYFIYNEEADIFRVGKSENIYRRVQSHLSGTGCTIKTVCTLEPVPGGFDYHKLESFILTKLKPYKNNQGDWFKLSSELVSNVIDFFATIEINYDSEFNLVHELPEKYILPEYYDLRK